MTRNHADEPPDQQAHGEEQIIQRFLAPLAAGYAGAFGLTDDCAAIAPPAGFDLVVKTDPVRAGVHFFADDAPADIAWKALAVNVSDLAAKGASAHVYLAALSFQQGPSTAWMAAFADGLRAAQTAFGCTLIGGDTDRADGPLTIAITAMGLVPHGKMVRRGAARAGDVVFVSGTLGDAALGLWCRRGDERSVGWPIDAAQRAWLVSRYLRPTPRLGLAAALRRHAHAAMDVSDGLHKDFDRMCRASGTGGLINTADLPLSAAVRAITTSDPSLASLCWSGGDDYEILCTVPPERADAFRAEAGAAGDLVTAIGRITSGDKVRLIDVAGRVVTGPAAGWDHF